MPTSPEMIDVRLASMLASPSQGGLVALHAARKLEIMAHSPAHYRILGRLVADPRPLVERLPEYARLLDEALAVPPSVGRQVNALEHVAGYFKRRLAPGEKRDLHAAIADYAAGRLPLGVVRAALRRLAERFGDDYLLSQSYLAPEPADAPR